MTIFLGILKGIGIFLLCLLAVLFLVLLLILLVPVRYRLQGRFEKKLTVRAQASWLLRFLFVRVDFDSGALAFQIRLAGFLLAPKKPGANPTKGGGKNAQTAQSEPPKPPAPDPIAACLDDAKERTAQSTPKEEPKPKEEAFDRTETKRASFGERVDSWAEALRLKLEESEKKLTRLCDNLDYYVDLWQQEDTRIALTTAVGQFARIFRHILPREFSLNCILGTKDPASLGQLMALQGMCYPLLHRYVRIEPDFEKQRLEGELLAKGRIRILFLLVCVLRILLKKEVLRLIKRLRRKKEDGNGCK